MAFVGRDEVRARLAADLANVPVTVVHGPPGIGKTTLVLATLHGGFAAEAGSILYIEAPRADDLTTALLRVLAEVSGVVEEIDWPALTGDRDAAIEALLDLAEASALSVVVDDLQRVEPTDVEVLVRQLSRYARASRWIFVDRSAPAPDQRIASHAVPGMLPAALEALAAEWAPELPPTARAAAAQHACGSPAALRGVLFGTSSFEAASFGAAPLAATSGGTSMTDTPHEARLPAGSEALIEALAPLRTPIPLALARQLVDPWPDGRALETLRRQGFLREGPAGLALHDVLRRDDRRPGARATRARVAHTLMAAARADLAIEGLRLAIDDGAYEPAAALLEGAMDRFLASGYGSALWALLEHRDAAELHPYRVRCASLMGNPTALSRVATATDEDDLGAWARSRLSEGKLRELCERLDPPAHLESRLVLARAWIRRGQPDHARTLLDGGGDDARVVALRVLASAHRGTLRDDPVAVAGRARALPPVQAPEALADLAEALRWAGRGAEAIALLPPAGTDTTLRIHRRTALLRLHLAIDRFDRAAAERELDALTPSLRSPSLQRPEIVHAVDRFRETFVAGDDVVSRIDAALDEARAYDARPVAAAIAARALARRLRAGAAADVDALLADYEDLAPPSVDGDALRLTIAEARIRSGARADGGRSGAPLLGARCATVDARAALVNGHPPSAFEAARRALNRALRVGDRGQALEARCALADVYLAEGAFSELRTLADDIHQDGPLGAQHAAFYRAVSNMDFAALESIAARREPLETARRAAALLGDASALDHLDRVVLARCGPRPRQHDGDAQGPPWGLDRRSRRAWRAGRWFDFSRKHVGWKLLNALADHAAVVGKERLVERVWGEAEYHPLRHDPRLQVAIRALREELEDDPSAPIFLQTTEGGYRVGGRLRIIDEL